MKYFDVIVIGGGPAGCYAALTAARNGVSVAIFEEHRAIGWPRHDPGWLMESDFAKSIASALGVAVVSSRILQYRLCDSESGTLIEESTSAGYLVRRELLEKEIAASAIQAGASLCLRTKVTKLSREEGRVAGIETDSEVVPGATGKIFICADGIRSSSSGFAAREALCNKQEVMPGISYLLANANVTAGVVEHFLSPDPVLNYRCFLAHSKSVCYLGLPASTTLQELRERQDNAVSLKIKDACAIEISGYTIESRKYGEYFNNMVKDNVMFVGDASGGAGNIHGMIQGKFAGMVAASAIKDDDVGEDRLSEYQDLVLKTLAKAPFYYFSAREDFGSFNDWFREFDKSTKGIEATELFHLR